MCLSVQVEGANVIHRSEIERIVSRGVPFGVHLLAVLAQIFENAALAIVERCIVRALDVWRARVGEIAGNAAQAGRCADGF